MTPIYDVNCIVINFSAAGPDALFNARLFCFFSKRVKTSHFFTTYLKPHVSSLEKRKDSSRILTTAPVNRTFSRKYLRNTWWARASESGMKAHVLSPWKLAGDWRCSRRVSGRWGRRLRRWTPAVTLTHIKWERPFVTIVTSGQLTLYFVTSQSNAKANHLMRYAYYFELDRMFWSVSKALPSPRCYRQTRGSNSFEQNEL